MQEIERIKVHPKHKKEIRKAAEFLIDRGWAQDPIVITEDDPDWEKIQKDSQTYGFLSRFFLEWNFTGNKSHIKEKVWFDGNTYYWIVLRLPVDPDEVTADPDTVDYIVIGSEVLGIVSFDSPLDYLLKDF